MKKSLFLIGFFPYCFWFTVILLSFSSALGVFDQAYGLIYWLIMALPVVFYVLARRSRTYLLKNADRAKLVQFDLLLNVVQSPAHLLNIYACVSLVLTLFGVVVVPYVIVVIVISFKLTGQIGREAVQWALEEGFLTQEEADRESKRQSVPVMSLISAMFLHRKTREVGE